MENKILKGIYLHGYQGFVTEDKKVFLDSFGEVYAPKIDYDNNPTILNQLYNQFKNEELDFVAGTSLGGILIYHLALLLEVPCLLLNPAVTALEQLKPYIPKEVLSLNPSIQVYVLVGLKDEIVNPNAQIEYFEKINDKTNNVSINIDENLEHYIPFQKFVDVFNDFRNII